MRNAVALALAATLGCSSTGESVPSGFPEAPLLVVGSASGELEIEVRTWPAQPPVRGSNRVELTLHDDGAPVGDVLIEAVPWMPSMGHGAPVEPHSEPAGDGRYVLSDVELYMPGRWDLRLTLGGAITDSAVLVLDVR